MTSSAPLEGSELIDCARANAGKGIEIAAQRCGYGDDLAAFEQQLRQAGQGIGVEIDGFKALSKTSNTSDEEERPSVIIAPESSTQF